MASSVRSIYPQKVPTTLTQIQLSAELITTVGLATCTFHFGEHDQRCQLRFLIDDAMTIMSLDWPGTSSPTRPINTLDLSTAEPTNGLILRDSLSHYRGPLGKLGQRYRLWIRSDLSIWCLTFWSGFSPERSSKIAVLGEPSPWVDTRLMSAYGILNQAVTDAD